MISASVVFLLLALAAWAQTTEATTNSTVRKLSTNLADGAAHSYQNYAVKVLYDGSAVVVYDRDFKQLFRLGKEGFEGNLTHQYSLGTDGAMVSFSGDEMFVTTLVPIEGSGVPSHVYTVNLKTGKLTKLIGLGEQFPVLGGLWKTPENPEGKGVVVSTGNYTAKMSGKYYTYLRLKRPDKETYTNGVYEITLPESGNNKTIKLVASPLQTETITRYYSPVVSPDGLLYYLTQEIENGQAAGKFFYVKSWSASSGTKEVYAHRRTQTLDLCAFSNSSVVAVNCGPLLSPKVMLLNEGKIVQQTQLASASSDFKEATWAKFNGLGTFLYSKETSAGSNFYQPHIGLVVNGETFPLTKSGDSYLGTPLKDFWNAPLPFECTVVASTKANDTYVFEPVVIQGVKHAEKVKLPGCFPGVTRENLQVFANGVRIYPDYANLFDPPTTRELSFKLPATVGGNTKFTVAIRHASAPQGWMRSVNEVTLDLPLNLPTVSVSASPSLLTPGGSVEISWQASLPARVTDVQPKPQGTLVLLPFNATSGKFSFKPSQAGIYNLEFTLSNGSKIAKEFEVKFTLPQITSVQNAAKDTAGLCPGAHATAFGSFASGDEIWAEYKPLPPTFFSTNQVNVIIPSDFGPGLIKVQAVRSGQIASEVEVQLLPACPAAFEYNGNAILTDENYQLAVDDTNAPVPGKAYTLWSNGCGPTDPYVPTGEPAPSAPLSQATMPVSLNIGGNEAQVLFAGLAPGLLQVCQINFVMPGMPHGSNPQPVALRIKVGEQESTSSTLTY